jgi:DNA-binding transcriptional LysR family regulator
MSRVEQISRRIKLRHLDLFVAVVEQGSMAQTAELLGTLQPVVSKAIADLERALGHKLLERGPRGVVPTIYGHALYRRSKAIFDDLRSSVNELELLADPTAGELRVGSTEACAIGLTPAILDSVARKHPRLRFEVVVADPQTLHERILRERRVDLVIGRRPATAATDELNFTRLHHDRVCVVAGATSPWTKRRTISLAELAGERWCLPPPSHPVGAMVAAAFRRNGLPYPDGAVTSQSAPFTHGLVSMGQHLGVLGSLFIGIERPRSEIAILPVDLRIPGWQTGIMTLDSEVPNPAVKPFLACAREFAATLDKMLPPSLRDG